MELTFDAAWLEAVMLAGVRMAAFLVIAPPFSHGAIPGRVKAMLAIALAIAVSPRVTQGYVSLGTAEFFGALLLEVLVGVVLGFMIALVFTAIQAAGQLIDLFGGLSMAQAYDPQSMVNGAQFARLFQFASLALMFTTDAYQVVIAGLVRSFDALPLAGGIDLAEPATALTGALTQMFLSSIQIAGPLLAVLFLADVGLGLITRVAPALNAFAMGFPLKIFLTVTLASVVFVGLPAVVSSLAEEALALLGAVG